MNPPIVYELTNPNAHNSTSTTATVHSMVGLLGVSFKTETTRGDGMPPRFRATTRYRFSNSV
jgi:hypothetical protein